jgi:hypothetical protein
VERCCHIVLCFWCSATSPGIKTCLSASSDSGVFCADRTRYQDTTALNCPLLRSDAHLFSLWGVFVLPEIKWPEREDDACFSVMSRSKTCGYQMLWVVYLCMLIA